jgi:hypothetical protein
LAQTDDGTHGVLNGVSVLLAVESQRQATGQASEETLGRIRRPGGNVHR